ncbi:MAG: hypothetical protein A3K10_08850 [Bacteroidetes bacterium RIFCSPLOWO2_12_FULL_31_6]|nr:MAG: hypothetical protein A3K10_08850 [Bacteroidetes bacterium RIFCSPLOWO2_12_FULL_31_6]
MGKGKNTLNEFKQLEAYGKSWGIVKYFSLNDEIDFDSIAIDGIKEILANDSSLNRTIDELLQKINIEDNNKSININEVDYKFKWLVENNSINQQNKSRLLAVISSYKANKNRYYNCKDSNIPYLREIPCFSNEKRYKDLGLFPPLEYRILALFRFWNIVHFFYPYKEQIKDDWKEKISEYTPLLINTSNDIAYHAIIFKLIASIEDSHTLVFSNAFFEKWNWHGFYPPFHVEKINNHFIIVRILDETLCNEKNIFVGDTIIKIDEENILEKYSMLFSLFGASNKRMQEFKICIYYLFNGGKDTDIKLTFLRYGKEVIENVKRNIGFGSAYFPPFPIPIENKRITEESSVYSINNDSICYIYVPTFSIQDYRKNRKELLNTKGLILDLRGYPKFEGMYALFKHFKVPRNDRVYMNLISQDNSNITIKRNKNLTIKYPLYSFLNKRYNGKIVCLINPYAISAMESLAMSLQKMGGYFIGESTAAGNGSISGINLPGGIYVQLSMIKVLFSNGNSLLPKGVNPDYLIPNSTINNLSFFHQALFYIEDGK